MSDLVADSEYVWTFVADTGDYYVGVLYQDTGLYVPGQYIDTQYGYYYINSATNYGFDLGYYYEIDEGVTYITTYYDTLQGFLQTYNYHYLQEPSGYYGLGSEYDLAWNGASWNAFGYAGSYQAGYYG